MFFYNRSSPFLSSVNSVFCFFKCQEDVEKQKERRVEDAEGDAAKMESDRSLLEIGAWLYTCTRYIKSYFFSREKKRKDRMKRRRKERRETREEKIYLYDRMIPGVLNNEWRESTA